MAIKNLIASLKKKRDDLSWQLDAGNSGSAASKFYTGKTADNLVKFEQSSAGKASLALKKTFIDTPVQFGRQMGSDLSQIGGMVNDYRKTGAKPTVGLNQQGVQNLKAQGGRALQTGSAIAGLYNPTGVATYSGLGGAINAGVNRFQNKSSNIGKDFLSGTVEAFPKALNMGGVTKYTNPLIGKTVGKIINPRIKLPVLSALNVGEGLLIDKASGMPTTKESMAVDAAFPLLGPAFRMVSKPLQQKLQQAIKTGGRNEVSKVLNEVKRTTGKTVVVNGKTYLRNALGQVMELGKDGKVKYSETPMITKKFKREVQGMRMGKPESIFMDDEKSVSALGLLGGIEPEYDENGKFVRFNFNGQKGAAGLALTAGISKIKGKGLPDIRSQSVEETEIKRVAHNILKNNTGITSKDSEAMAKDVISNRAYKQLTPQIDRTRLTGMQLETPNAKLQSPEMVRVFGKPNTNSGTAIPQSVNQVPRVTGKIEPQVQGIQGSNPRVLQDEKPFGINVQSQEGQTQLKSQLQSLLSRTPQDKQNLILNSRTIDSTSDDIIQQGRKEISRGYEPDKRSFKQVLNDTYTQWVNRYAPIERIAEQAKKSLKVKGAVLRPEHDPIFLVRRLTGAGGIADHRYQSELKPIIHELDNLKIDKSDFDVYLKARRDIGLSERDIKGSDGELARRRMEALEAKYPDISTVSQRIYDYQNKGFQELIDAGFLSKESADLIRKQNPDYVPFQRVMDELDEYLGVPTRQAMQGSQVVKKIEGSERAIYSPLESVIANTFKQRSAIEKNRVAKSIVDLQKLVDLGIRKADQSGTDTITVWNNGTKEYYSVGKDIADTAKGLNEENMNTLLKVLQVPASLLRQGATGRNPDFMIPNIVRDQLDAAITSKYGYIPFVDYTRGLIEVVKKDLNNAMGTKFNTDIYDRWSKSGARIDLGELSGRKSIQQSLDNAKAKRKLLSWVGRTLDVMGKYSEQPTRIGLFKKAYKKTGNETLAMMESRDSTVDFARMGSKMKVANSVIPFLNVGIQGFDKLIRSVKNNPAKVAVNMGIYGALPAVSTVIYNLTNFPEEYAEIPQYEKDSNFIIVTGRNDDGTVDYISIPKGNILPIVTNPIESLVTYMAGQDQQSFKEFAIQFVSGTLPVIGDGSSVKEVTLKTIGSNLPQMIKPATENLLNKSFWKYDTKKEESKEIVPFYLKKNEPYKQAYEWTPITYKAIGGVLNVSPLQVQNVMEGYLAGYVKVPNQIIGALKAVSEGKEVNNNDKTILRRFIKTTYPSSGAKQEPEKPKTPFWERITGKAAASTTDEPLELPKDKATFNVVYKDLVSEVASLEKKSKTLPYEYRPKDKEYLRKSDVEENTTKLKEAKALLEKTQKEKPDMVFDAEIETYKSGGGMNAEERGAWVQSQLSKTDETKKQDLINKLWENKVLTTGKSGLAQYLEDEFGLDVWKYTGTNEDVKKTTTKKGKKAKIKFTPPKYSNSAKASFTPIKIKSTSAPKLKIAQKQNKSVARPDVAKLRAKLKVKV